MMIFRKKTGVAVGQDVPADMVETYLSVLPAGVYGVENAYGVEVAEARVWIGRVKFANRAACAGWSCELHSC